MLHKFFEPGDWFAPKRFGYGAGLPIAWQGWVLLASYVAALAGVGLLANSGDARARTGAFMLFVILTILLVEITRRRTRGGWKWRSGRPD